MKRNPYLVAAWALTLAARDEGVTPPELGQVADITPHTAHHALMTLLRAGFISRTREAGDGHSGIGLFRYLYFLTVRKAVEKRPSRTETLKKVRGE